MRQSCNLKQKHQREEATDDHKINSRTNFLYFRRDATPNPKFERKVKLVLCLHANEQSFHSRKLNYNIF